jgi:hypothetical protein
MFCCYEWEDSFGSKSSFGYGLSDCPFGARVRCEEDEDHCGFCLRKASVADMISFRERLC